MKQGLQHQLGPFTIHLDQRDEAFALVEKWHYSHRVPGVVTVIVTAHDPGGLFGDLGEAVAACLWSLPPRLWDDRKGGQILELSRLVRREDVTISLTGLIGWAVKYLRWSKRADLVISYADIQQSHHGGVYQASSWFYHGRRAPKVEGYLSEGGTYHPKRTVWSRSRMEASLPEQKIEDKHDKGKHLYWKPLNKQGWAIADDLRLQRNFYPKPARPSVGARRWR